MEARRKVVPSVTGWEGQVAPSKAIGLLWLPHPTARNTGMSCPSPEAVDFMVSLPRNKGYPAWPSCQYLSRCGLMRVDPQGGGLCAHLYSWGRVCG